MVRRLAGVMVAVTAAALVAACGVGVFPDTRPRVVATTSIVADWVTAVGGDRVAVSTIVPANADAHTFEPTPADVRRIAEARAVFAIGLGFEEWLDSTIKNAGGNARELKLSEGVTLIKAEEHDDHAGEKASDKHAGEAKGHAGEKEDKHGEYDPHVWHDVANAVIAVTLIERTLSEIDPANAAVYRQNANTYRARLQTLDAWVRAETARIPENRRKLVTNHDTFQYYARAYGLTVLGTVIGGVSTEREPSAAELATLVRSIRAAGVPAIFAENIGNPRLTETVAREAGVKVVTDLYTDALGRAGTPGATYEGMIRHNTQRFVENLR